VVTPGDRGFPRKARLLRPSEFDRVYRFRRRAAEGPIVLYACPQAAVVAVEPADPPPARLGLSVSRRVGNAVVRNGWKRRLREAFRAVRGQLPAGQDYVVVVRAAEIPHGVGGASATEAWLVGLAHRIVSRPGYRTATLPAVRATKPRRR
jgi:ribonuclease P protein component